MSEQTKLRVFERSIAIPGCRFQRSALLFDRVDGETLVAAGAFLQSVDACAAWWWGDFLAAYCGYELKAEEDENGALDELTRQDRLKQYSARYATISGKEPKTLWHWKSAADFYNSSRRREELSWSHHIEAQGGSSGDKAVADGWLDKAVEHRWSVSELRAAIRREKRALTEPDEPLPQLVLPMELVEARRYASAAIKRVDDMAIDEARALLVELMPIVKFAHAIAERAGQILPTTPGKESLHVAS
jgi:hypothetical protein